MHNAYYNTIFSVVDMHSLFIDVQIILTDAGSRQYQFIIP